MVTIFLTWMVLFCWFWMVLFVLWTIAASSELFLRHSFSSATCSLSSLTSLESIWNCSSDSTDDGIPLGWDERSWLAAVLLIAEVNPGGPADWSNFPLSMKLLLGVKLSSRGRGLAVPVRGGAEFLGLAPPAPNSSRLDITGRVTNSLIFCSLFLTIEH